jgi:hypothetical protein
MLTNSRHTTGIRHAPRQWYFIHPVIIAGTVSAPTTTTTSDAGFLNSALPPHAHGSDRPCRGTVLVVPS